tara:strand:+ start:76 stop:351 length:276 start_codon:yes stop_codon:yes gene_type:complete
MEKPIKQESYKDVSEVVEYWKELEKYTDYLENKPNTESNLPLHIVREPLQTLKKIVADKTIELIEYDKNDRYANVLRNQIELVIKSIEAIK